jgi:hypothetical protein
MLCIYNLILIIFTNKHFRKKLNQFDHGMKIEKLRITKTLKHSFQIILTPLTSWITNNI